MNDLASLIERLGYSVRVANDITGRDIVVSCAVKDRGRQEIMIKESNQ